MKVGIIFIAVAWGIFFILSLIGRLCRDGRTRRELFDFEIDDLTDYHVKDWFWSKSKQFAYRTALAVSFCLYAVGVIVLVFSLNCLPDDFVVVAKLCIAFFGGIIAGWFLMVSANFFAMIIPVIIIAIALLPMMFFDWLRDR